MHYYTYITGLLLLIKNSGKLIVGKLGNQIMNKVKEILEKNQKFSEILYDEEYKIFDLVIYKFPD